MAQMPRPMAIKPQRRYGALAEAMMPQNKRIAQGDTQLYPDAAASQRILGTQESRKTPAQQAEQDKFDESFGFTKTGGTPVAEKILSNRSARLKKDAYDLDYAENTPTGFGSDYVRQQEKAFDQRTAAPTARPATAPVHSSEPGGGMRVRATGDTSALEAAGSRVGPLAGATNYKPTADVAPAIPVRNYQAPASPDVVDRQPAPMPATPTVNPTPTVTPTPTAPPPGPTPAPTPTLQPTPAVSPTVGPGMEGRQMASGVSNSQAAGFEQPTKENAIPKTPTTPVMDVNDYDVKKKRQFAGF